MKIRLFLAALVLGAFCAPAEAGPLRRFIENRRAARSDGGCCSSGCGGSATVSTVRGMSLGSGGGCANGVCPIK